MEAGMCSALVYLQASFLMKLRCFIAYSHSQDSSWCYVFCLRYVFSYCIVVGSSIVAKLSRYVSVEKRGCLRTIFGCKVFF